MSAMMQKFEELGPQAFFDNLVEHKNAGMAGQFLGCPPSFYHEVERMAFRMYRRRRYDKAEVLMRGLIELDGARPYPYLMLGDLMLRTERYEEAVGFLETAHELDPSDAMTRSKLGEVLVRLGETAAARGHLEAVVGARDLADTAPERRRAKVLLSVIDRIGAR